MNIHEVKLHEMKLHDTICFNLFAITRVPGGWIYFNNEYGTSQFVPYSSEFDTRPKYYGPTIPQIISTDICHDRSL